ncbi:MAG TPA: 2-oxo acid dehydrogenase subunit E2 [Coriobacteriia bacterium]|jgi:pyruvate/2-oxoglutarate dehydrogenase complex dihydrolipoamide acyltransferase (E2) component
MSERRGYRVEPFSGGRQMVAASSAVGRQKDTIHLVTEVDINEPRRFMAEHRERTGERLSLTGHVVSCLAQTVGEFPTFNSFRKGSRIVVLDDVTISVLFERETDGESVPEPVGIQAANRKTYRQIHDELRAVQRRSGQLIGTATGTAWIRFIPGFLLRAFIRLASRNIAMQKRFGVIGVTAVGMFAAAPTWLVPLTSATVTVAVGSIAKRLALVDGTLEEREYLCLTVSFDHDIVDGAPAARFTSRFAELLSSGSELR